ncbi:hypothetical protein DXG01_002291 [Tephrocybe rancida]|nr:hypothetical protein DXG01_002291 [Tephrocybe rancida]
MLIKSRVVQRLGYVNLMIYNQPSPNNPHEITRVFKFAMKTGQNQITINGLPDVLDEGSFRVEGRGAATIHGVSSYTHRPSIATTTAAISALESKRERTSKALERCKMSIFSLEAYLNTMHVKIVDVMQVRNVVKEYDATAEELDNRVLELEAQLHEIIAELGKEHVKRRGPDSKLNKRVVIGVFADVEGEVEIVLIYAVKKASWTARYDIRVNTTSQEEPVTLMYKAAITQNTGEDWSDVPLILEMASPTFGVDVPKLDSWNLSIYNGVPPIPTIRLKSVRKHDSTFLMARIMQGGPDNKGVGTAGAYDEPIVHRELYISSKGNVSATFRVPVFITIPSDGVAHNVTIVQLQLGATMSWVCVPKIDTKTHLNSAPGKASPVLSGSTPRCARVKKLSESGFYTKTTTQVFTQGITVHNTRSTLVERVRIAEQIPVPDDVQIQVKLVTPTLVLKERDGDEALEKPVAVSKGVSALWEGRRRARAEFGDVGQEWEVQLGVCGAAAGKDQLGIAVGSYYSYAHDDAWSGITYSHT